MKFALAEVATDLLSTVFSLQATDTLTVLYGKKRALTVKSFATEVFCFASVVG